MNLVQVALRRPTTVVVIVAAVLLATALALQRMPRDIFPTLGIPTIYVAQPYGGMDPAQMEGYLTYYYEYHFLYITGIEHVESKSIQGAAIMKLQFYPGTDMNQAMAETVGYVNRARAFMPPGTVPPFITRFDAGSVPVGDLVFTSETATVAQMQDAALNRVRPLFATLPGVSAPPPFGGSARTIVINVDPERLRSYNMSPDEIVGAITRANLISPSGNMAVSGKYPMVPLNSVVKNIKDLESVPIRTGTYPTVFVRDVGEVVDGSDIVTSYALVDGRRTVYVPVTKRADASTLAVVNLVKQNLPRFQAAVAENIHVSYEFDQSPYVIRAIRGLAVEGMLGAILTGVMVLLFLRDWRSSLIVVLNIPLAIIGALFALALTGQTINIMTLGGLALAIGVLVDMSTVVIENIHTHLASGKRVARAVVDSGREVAAPLLIAMLCVLAVFTPSLFMEGAARAMFLPLSLAVGFAMVASYVLSSTLVPILSVWLLRGHAPAGEATEVSAGGFRRAYAGLVDTVVRLRWLVVAGYATAAAFIIVLVGGALGTEIFPRVDTGQLQVRLRAPTGTRVDGTEQLALQALDVIKDEVGADNVRITLAFLGVHAPNYPINLIYLWNGGSEEGVLQVQLKDEAGVDTEALKERLRAVFAQRFPDASFSFEPSDIVSQVMSLGSPTPIEVAVSGPNLAANREFAARVRDRLARIPALRDVRLGQALDYPTLDVNVSRERAGLMGVEMSEVSRSLVAATSSSRFVVPNYWADPNSGVAYQIQVQIPQTTMSSVEELENIPVAYNDGVPVLLRSVADVTPGTAPGQYERYNMERMITVTANLSGDLGTAAASVRAALTELGEPPPRVSVALRGQVVPMEQLFDGFGSGLIAAIAIIFLLLAANFQSFRLALAVISTAPAAIAGSIVALWLTGTTLNIQSFMGAIMAVGVAVANAILLVTFAERSRIAGNNAAAAAAQGARSRLRPILMTSFAMIAGMLPLAIGFGEGGEQTAPLGRAVAGGLLAATLATLVVLPAVFAAIQARAHRRSPSLDPDDMANQSGDRA
ncbi:MAG TPA: efflux RND transporter permease subunit [Gammaproteobacteria bacterium]